MSSLDVLNPIPVLPTLISTLRTGAVALLTTGLTAAGAAGQVRVSIPTELEPSVSVVLRVEGLYKAGEYRESLALLEPYRDSSPEDYRAWVLSARDALTLGYASSDPDSAKAWLRRSIAFGEAAIALDGYGLDGRYMALAAKGRLALISGPRERARLGGEVDNDARALLAIDSLYAGAHNALGRLYMEVASLSWAERLIARAWVGGDLVSRGKWEAAEWHLRKAIELQPERNYYRLDLGALLVARKRPDEARRVLQETLDVPLETPAQEGFRVEARALLRNLDDGRAPSAADSAGHDP